MAEALGRVVEGRRHYETDWRTAAQAVAIRRVAEPPARTPSIDDAPKHVSDGEQVALDEGAATLQLDGENLSGP